MSEELSKDLQENIYTDETLGKISNGLLQTYIPDLKKSQKQLFEITEKQEMLSQVLHDENLKISWTQNSVELHKMFDIIATYQNKLTDIKKDMKKIHETNLKLKKRALKLQQHKEKVDYVLNQQKVDQLRRDQNS